VPFELLLEVGVPVVLDVVVGSLREIRSYGRPSALFDIYVGYVAMKVAR
jgi:hypothetical protein